MLASPSRAGAHRRWMALPLLLVAMLIVAGCGSDDSTDNGGAKDSAPATTEAADDEASAPEPVDTDTVLATTQSQLGSGQARLDINALRQRGKVIELHFTVTNTGETRFGALGAFDSDEDQQLDSSVGAVYLVNPEARQRHLPLLDEAGECVCSDAPSAFEPGVPVRLNASFAAPEEPVDAMTVAVPNFGSISDVPVDNG